MAALEVVEGNTILTEATFSTLGIETNPTTVTAVLQNPYGVETALSPLLKDGTTSTYQASFLPATTGYHTVRYVGSYLGGTEFATAEILIRVLPTEFN